MPTAAWLRDEEESEWNSYVSRNPSGLIYHLGAWKQVLEYAFPHIRGRFLALREEGSGRILGGLPVYTVRSWVLGNRIVSIPFASFCDPLISSCRDFQDLLPSLAALLDQTASKFVEIRSMRKASLIGESGLTPAVHHKHHFIPLDGSLDELFCRFSKTGVRQGVRRAEKNGITVRLGDNRADLEAFYHLIFETRRRLALPPIPMRFFEGIWNFVPLSDRKLFIGWHKDTPIGCLLVLQSGSLWAAEYSGDSNAARNSGVNQVLYWEAIQLAHSQGARAFSLGRTSVTNPGLMSYKRKWAAVEEDLPQFCLSFKDATPLDWAGHRAFDSMIMQRMARSTFRLAPAPIYRKLGEYLYHHMG